MDNSESDGSSGGLPRWLLWVPGIARHIWGLFMPAPEFRAPTPEISRLEEHDWQWWHIPVSVKRKFPRRDIPDCRISVTFLEGQYTGQEFPLRWRSDLPRGSSEAILLFGALRKIPLVVRRDNSPAATLTDHGFLTRDEGDYGISGITGQTAILSHAHYHDRKENLNLEPGNHKIILKIESGHLHWKSKPYVIRVPAASASNSHFNVVGSD